jgi:cyclopropane fatty-acyl-phospholipid synthase-like methyltransferase
LILPCSPACERNRDSILAVLREHFADSRRVLEIGSGTGQHAVHFAAALPWLQWQCSDRPGHLEDVCAWLGHAGLPNTPAPLELDVADRGQWPDTRYDAAFSANTLHIMGWPQVCDFFALLGQVLEPNAKLLVYGPFNYKGQFTSPSNAAFDAQLRATHPERGIRDFEQVDALARQIGLSLQADIAMPANNRCLMWRRSF